MIRMNRNDPTKVAIPRPGARKPMAQRIEAKTDRRGPDECWPWTGATGQWGHPVISIDKNHTAMVRRVVWEAHNGPIPARRWATNNCGNKICLNPKHITLRAHHDDALRFWENVQKGDGCWEWTGATDVSGYGKLKIWAIRAPVRANRFSWELHFGAINDPLMFVCHRCDNRKCVRPEHLFLGTVFDNNADMTAKGRRSRGEKHRIATAPALAKAKEVLAERRRQRIFSTSVSPATDGKTEP